ncbi:cohesin domain-containing protein [Cohnella lupini]|uniref:Cohesin domain-containing protein n=1 Tax=Cohnella lupini TaxID=1294267 RepID=A0A3D9IBN3_9BACL|nr:cohesin domain-containing protein [Cohnella lupini]
MIFSSMTGIVAASVQTNQSTIKNGYQLEYLDRGLVAAKVTNGVFLSWRLLGNEVTGYSDEGLTGANFNVYRDGEKIATVTDSTNYLDAAGTVTSEYSVVSVVNDVEKETSDTVTPWANNYLDIPLKVPAPGQTPKGEAYTYSANDTSVGDVDGDGQYELFVKWDPSNSKDVSQKGYTGNEFIDCYTLEGKLLYRIDLGVNIRAGSHYTQFSVYDFDGDGKAEVMFKTAPGTKVIKYDEAGNVASERYITMLPEDIAAGYSNTDDYRYSADDYYDHLVRMFQDYQNHPEVVAGHWPATLEEAFRPLEALFTGSQAIPPMPVHQYPLSLADAQTLADYYIDVLAPKRSANNQLRTFEGFILSGPEYLSIFNGETGDEMETIRYKVGRTDDGLMWGDYALGRVEPGNRVDRYMSGIAFLDGKKPYSLVVRGVYTRVTMVAYSWNGEHLEEYWTVDSGWVPMTNPFFDNPHGRLGTNPGYEGLTTQGGHSMTAADVDSDGKQEIIYAASTIDDDGTVMYNSAGVMPVGSEAPGQTRRIGHGDMLHVADIDPDRPGLEIFMVHEGAASVPYGYTLRDALTGEIIYGAYTGRDTGRGMVGDINPNVRGLETWAVSLLSATGAPVSGGMPGTNMSIKWNADMTTQIVDGSGNSTPTIQQRYPTVSTVLTATGTRTNNSTKGNPNLVADIFGDWREELIVRTADSSALRIFESTSVTDHKLHTLMHDAQYRAQVAGQQTVYNQADYTSYYFAGDTDFSKVKVLDFWTPLVNEVTSGGILSGVDAVTSGQPFDITYGLQNIANEVIAQDITVSYDADTLEFIAPPTSLDEQKIVIANYDDKPGSVRILLVHLGDKQTEPNGNLIKLSFKAKQTAESGITSIAIDKLVNANGLGEESSISGSSHEVQIDVIDKSVLTDLIAEAHDVHDDAVEGSMGGQYPVGSKATLQTAIDDAKQIADDATSTQTQIEQAASELSAALQAFKALVIVSVPGDYNNDSNVSVGDLAIMVKAYGGTSSDANWNQIKHLDMNKDGVIDIADLVAIALLIFNK